KTLILVVVAVGCGLVASYMTSKLLAERRSGEPQEEKVDIVVSKTKVPKWTLLKEPEKYFEVMQRSKSEAPKGKFISDLRELKDKPLNREFKPATHPSPEDVRARMTALPIPDGLGAIGVKVNAASAAGFFVNPGDKVDMILTQGGPPPVSATIL